MSLLEYKNKVLGKQVEFHSFGSGAFNQCIDLINDYINKVLDNNTKDYTEIIGTDAKDLGTKYDKDDFDWIPNTPEAVIKAGDIAVWNGNVGGGAGHVAIALEDGTINNFKSLDQNWSQKERVTLENHNYNNVLGWLRPKKTNTVEVDSKTFENLVTKATAYDNLLPEHDRVKHLLSENERVNKEKDVIIQDLNAKNEQLRLELQACENKSVPPQNPPETSTGSSNSILERLSRFLEKLGF